jgi:transcriptional regulator GlxA family with amidase domain
MDPRIEKTIGLLEESLHRTVHYDEIARTVNLSLPRLRSLFKAETGEPLARYHKALRMREARRLLEETFLSIKQIMRRVGINDESHFVRDFKKINAVYPTQYRARLLHRRDLRDGNDQDGQQIVN